MFFVLSVPVGANVLFISPATSSVNTGDSFTLDIRGNFTDTTIGGGLDVMWDPAVVALSSLADVTITLATADPWLTDKGSLSPGMLGNIFAGDFFGFSGNFDFASLTFTAIAAGSTQITLGGLDAINPWGDLFGDSLNSSLTFDGASVDVSAPSEAVPEPGSLLLIGSGLIGFIGFAKKRAG